MFLRRNRSFQRVVARLAMIEDFIRVGSAVGANSGDYLLEKHVQQLSQQAVRPVEIRGGRLADRFQQAGFPFEPVHLGHLFQGLVDAPSALLRSGEVDPGKGEICRVARHVVNELREDRDDHALASQLQRRAQAKDQLLRTEIQRYIG